MESGCIQPMIKSIVLSMFVEGFWSTLGDMIFPVVIIVGMLRWLVRGW